MNINVNLKIIKDSKDIKYACLGYITFTKLITSSRRYGMSPIMTVISMLNKDIEYLIKYDSNHTFRSLIDKLSLNQKLSKEDKLAIKKLKKLKKIKENKEHNKVVNKYLEKYVLEFKKITKIFEKIYDKVEADLNILTVSNVNMRKGGTATNHTCIFETEDATDMKNIYNSIKQILTHEIIHSCNKQCKTYMNLKNKIQKNNYSKNVEQNIFEESFTSIIEQICSYELKISKDLFDHYYFRNKVEQKTEEKIRKIYKKYKASKNKKSFVEYLSKEYFK